MVWTEEVSPHAQTEGSEEFVWRNAQRFNSIPHHLHNALLQRTITETLHRKHEQWSPQSHKTAQKMTPSCHPCEGRAYKAKNKGVSNCIHQGRSHREIWAHPFLIRSFQIYEENVTKCHSRGFPECDAYISSVHDRKLTKLSYQANCSVYQKWMFPLLPHSLNMAATTSRNRDTHPPMQCS